jgi:hypothetical protein
MNDWNLDISNGCDITHMILNLSNDEYDFSTLLDRVNTEAID